MLKNNKVRGLLQMLLSLVLLSWLLYRVGLEEVVATLANMRWAWYLPALLLFQVNIVIRTYRWYILQRSLNSRSSFGHLLYLYYVGFFWNNFIPSGFGGDAAKVVGLRQRYGRGAEALSSVMMDRITGLMGSATIAFIALASNGISHAMRVDLPGELWSVILLISIGIPGSFLLVRRFDPLGQLSARHPGLTGLPKFDKLEQLNGTVRRYPFPALFRSLLTSLPFTFNLILIQFSIARALSVELPLAVFALFVPLIALMNLLPISFNGLGVREGVYIFLFTPLGVPPETAVAMSLAFYFLRFTAGLLGGALVGLSSLTHLARPAQSENL